MRSLFNIGNKIKPFNRNFIIEVNTELSGVSNSDQFQFTGAVGEYDVEAYQDNSLVATFENLVDEQTITLSNAGIYELRCIIKPAGFDKMTFNNTGDRLKLLKILNWGLYGVNEPNQLGAFRGCENNTEISGNGAWFDVVTNGTRMFLSNNLTSLPPYMNLPLLEIGGFMFSNNLLTSLPVGMNLPLLENGFFMFQGNNLTSLPTNMNLPLLTSASRMFANNNLTSLPAGMNLPLLTNGSFMFQNNDLTSLPTNMNLPLLTNGGAMFQNNNNLTSLPVGMDLPLLTNGRDMFRDNNLTSLPVGMELPNLADGTRMFQGNTINTERYSQLLIDLEANNNNNNVNFHGGSSKYNAQGEIARNALIARGWTITDGGLEN